jgi:hypothetical protein
MQIAQARLAGWEKLLPPILSAHDACWVLAARKGLYDKPCSSTFQNSGLILNVL